MTDATIDYATTPINSGDGERILALTMLLAEPEPTYEAMAAALNGAVRVIGEAGYLTVQPCACDKPECTGEALRFTPEGERMMDTIRDIVGLDPRVHQDPVAIDIEALLGLPKDKLLDAVARAFDEAFARIRNG